MTITITIISIATVGRRLQDNETRESFQFTSRSLAYTAPVCWRIAQPRDNDKAPQRYYEIFFSKDCSNPAVTILSDVVNLLNILFFLSYRRFVLLVLFCPVFLSVRFLCAVLNWIETEYTVFFSWSDSSSICHHSSAILIQILSPTNFIIFHYFNLLLFYCFCFTSQWN